MLRISVVDINGKWHIKKINGEYHKHSNKYHVACDGDLYAIGKVVHYYDVDAIVDNIYLCSKCKDILLNMIVEKVHE